MPGILGVPNNLLVLSMRNTLLALRAIVNALPTIRRDA